MEHSRKNEIIQAIRTRWENENLLEAGVILFERIPRLSRPQWGANVLEVVSRSVFTTPEIEDVIAFARTPEEWADGSHHKSVRAHNFFDAVRSFALEYESSDRMIEQGVLILAENVAKVTYNAYGYSAPFDHHAGWWIPAILKSIIDKVNDPELTPAAWSALVQEQYIELEAPVRCNPYCSGQCYLLKAFEV